MAAAWRALWQRKPKTDEQEKGVEQFSSSLSRMLVARGESPRRGTRELLAAFAESPWIRGVVGRIAWEVASAARWELWDGPEEDEDRRKLPAAHPLLKFLRRPSTRLTSRLLWAQVQAHIELCGEGFLMIDRNLAGVPVELSPASPAWITMTASDLIPYFAITHETYHRDVPREDMLWPRDINPAFPYGRGSGIAHALADELDTDESAARMTKAFFQNGSVPDIMIAAIGADEKALIAMEEKWRSKYSGPAKAHQAHFTGRDLKVQRLDTSFKDQDLVKLREHERDMIVQVWGVPPEIFGILQNSNRATIEAAYYLFAKSLIVPRLTLLRDEMQMRLVPEFERAFPEYGDELHLGFASPIPDDRDFFIRSVGTAPNAFRASEVRRKNDLQPDADIDATILGAGGTVTPSQLPGAGAPEQEPGSPTAQPAEVAGPADGEAPKPDAAPKSEEVDIPIAEDGMPADIQSMALNGAQIESMLSILAGVSDGSLPAASAIQALLVAFPVNIDLSRAHALVDPISPVPSAPAQPIDDAATPPAG